jgi:hypothetical protein
MPEDLTLVFWLWAILGALVGAAIGQRKGRVGRIKQVWFPGVHSDVGGGYPDAEGGLSKVAFEWMIREVQDLGAVRLEAATVEKLLDSTGTGKYSRPDPLAGAHESLERFWHLMEWLPRRLRQKVEDEGAHGDAQASSRGRGRGRRSAARPAAAAGRLRRPQGGARSRVPAAAGAGEAARESGQCLQERASVGRWDAG